MKKLAVLLMLLLPGAPIFAAPLVFGPGFSDGQTTVFGAPLAPSGLTQLGSVFIADSNSGTGGSAGIFSGFDLDFVFVDLDGNYATAGDRVSGTAFLFTTGAIRPTVNPDFLPTVLHPGPTFGSLAANSIDAARATLNTRDGFFAAGFSADSNADGWLTLGDGGTLGVGFGAGIALSGTEVLFIGEVGTDIGELANASVTASENPIPVPGTLALLALGAFGLGITRQGLRQQR